LKNTGLEYPCLKTVIIFGLSFSCDTCLYLSENGYRLYREAGNRDAMGERNEEIRKNGPVDAQGNKSCS